MTCGRTGADSAARADGPATARSTATSWLIFSWTMERLRQCEAGDSIRVARELDLAALGGSCNVLARAKRERLDRHRRLTAPRGYEAAAIADEEVRDVVRAM